MLWHLRLLLLLTAAVVVVTSARGRHDLWVGPATGFSAHDTGTPVAARTAFSTVNAAVEAAAALLAPKMKRGPDGAEVVIHLAPGEHNVGHQPLQLDWRHDNLVFMGHGTVAAPSSVSGGRHVPAHGAGLNVSGAWAVFGPAQCVGCTQVWRAPIPKGLDSRQFYVNGVRANRTWAPFKAAPNTSDARGTTPGDPASDKILLPGNEMMLAWTHNVTAIELVYRGGSKNGGGSQWQESRCPVATIRKTPTVPTSVGDEGNALKCCASFCKTANCPICCHQTGSVAKSHTIPCNASTSQQCSVVCPAKTPFCVGYSVSVNWGHCVKTLPPIRGVEITVQQPCVGNGNMKCAGGQAQKVPVYVENVFELLGSESHGHPGDFFLDASAGFVYYVPNAGERLETTVGVVPMTEVLVEAKGVRGITYHNIVFEYTTWMRPSTPLGFVDVQSGYCLTCPNSTVHCLDCSLSKHYEATPAALRFFSSSNVTFTGCTFRHLGSNALSFSLGSQGNTVTRSKFYDLSASAIAIGNRTDPIRPKMIDWDLDNTVIDSSIHHIAREYRGAPGILVGYTRATSLLHNEISHVPYSGISLGWGWDSFPYSYDGANRLEGNHIHHHMQVLGDGAGIYTLGTQGNLPFAVDANDRHYKNTSVVLPPSTMLRNYIHDGGNAATAALDHDGLGAGCFCPGGLYTDEGSTNWNMSLNVIAKVEWWLNGCRNQCDWIGPNYQDNNWYDSASKSQIFGPSGVANNETRCPTHSNTEVNGSQWPKAALEIMAAAGPRPVDHKSNHKPQKQSIPKALSILPLRDSITYGCGDNCSSLCSSALPCVDCLKNKSYTPCARCSSGYRLLLWQSLQASGFSPTMIGPLTEGPAGAPPAAVRHAGWPGIRISGTPSPGHTEGLVQAAQLWGKSAAEADVILLHIGTNDVLQNQYATPSVAAADMGGQLSVLLAVIRQLAPQAMVYVASIISFAPASAFAALNDQIAAYNAVLPFIVDGYIAGGGHAVFVDMARQSANTCAKAGSCCPGGIHPTVQGYASMAAVWHSVLTQEENLPPLGEKAHSLKTDDAELEKRGEEQVRFNWWRSQAVQQMLRTRAAFFIEASAMLSRASSIHDALWGNVRKIGAPQTMFSPWAPYPHFCVGELTPPTNNGTRPCKTSWNMTLMDEMVNDYLNATSFDRYTPFFEFTQSPCWLYHDGDCVIPRDPLTLSPSHKSYASGTQLVDPSRTALGDYFGRLAAWYRAGKMTDECGTVHTNPRGKIPIAYWGVENEGEHGAGDPWTNIANFDAIVNGIKRHEVGGEFPMKYVAVNQNFGNDHADPARIRSWVRTFLNRSNHADPTVPIDVIAFHGYFHGEGNTREGDTRPLLRQLDPLAGWHSLAASGSAGNGIDDALFMRACSYDGFVTRALKEPKLGKGQDSSWFVAQGLANATAGSQTVSFRSFPEKFCPQPGALRSECPWYLVVNSSNGRVHLARDDSTTAFARAATFSVTTHAHASTVSYSFASLVDGLHHGSLLASSPAPATGTCSFHFGADEGNLVVTAAASNRSMWSVLPPNYARVRSLPVCDTWGLKDADLISLFKSVDTFMKQTVDLFVSLRLELDLDVELSVTEFGVILKGDIDTNCSQIVALRPNFQLAAAAVFGYGYGLLAERGLDSVLQSQYTGHSAGTIFTGVPDGKLPRNYYPALALYNWTTGTLQPRSVVNQIIVAHIQPGVDLVVPNAANNSNESVIYALGFESSVSGARKMLIVNKGMDPVDVNIDTQLRGGIGWVVDSTYTTQPSPRKIPVVGTQLHLLPFATAVVVKTPLDS